jgi:hypothetical protein
VLPGLPAEVARHREGAELTAAEQAYVVDVICRWIGRDVSRAD